MIITIDGPSGAGKSTISKLLSDEINFEYLDTGAMYRSITFFLLENKVNVESERDTKEFLNSKYFKDNFNLQIKENKFFINDRDVSKEIRTSFVTDNVSIVSSYDFVRELLVEEQRKISKNEDIVLDGRDTGSVVFPNADYKFYLTASIDERAKRRYLQENNNITYQEVYDSIKTRDYKDKNRKISPLIIPENAVVIDSTELSIDETVNKIISHIKEDNSDI